MRHVYIADVLDMSYLQTSMSNTNSILTNKCKYTITKMPKQVYKHRIIVESTSSLSLTAMEQTISIIVGTRKLMRIE